MHSMEVQTAVAAEEVADNKKASPFLAKIVAPGDVVLDMSSVPKPPSLGAGLRQDGTLVTVTNAGRLKSLKANNKYIVEGSQKKYIPEKEDKVIGVVVDRRFESFLVDIGGPSYASLSVFAFEGVSRRNLPNLQPGAAVFARVTRAHRHVTPDLACTDADGKKAEFGPLKAGYIFECSTGLARGLLNKPPSAVLTALEKGLSFQLSVGANGRVWVEAPTAASTILVANAISNSEFLSATQQQLLVSKLLENLES